MFCSVAVYSTSVGLCRGRGSMLKSPWMGSMVLSSTLKKKKMNPYKAGPKPLHKPLMPVIIPCATPADTLLFMLLEECHCCWRSQTFLLKNWACSGLISPPSWVIQTLLAKSIKKIHNNALIEEEENRREAKIEKRKEGRERQGKSPCLSGSADCDTRAETAGKVMEDIAATAPAAHIILLTPAHVNVSPFGDIIHIIFQCNDSDITLSINAEVSGHSNRTELCNIPPQYGGQSSEYKQLFLSTGFGDSNNKHRLILILKYLWLKPEHNV